MSVSDTWASPCRLFALEPDLLPLFQYNCRQFSSPEDCLSSPEFLDHIRKVRGGTAPVASGIQQSTFPGENEGLGQCKSLPFPARPGPTPLLLLSLRAALDPVWGCRPSPHPVLSQLVPALSLPLSPGSFGWCWRSSIRGHLPMKTKLGFP